MNNVISIFKKSEPDIKKDKKEKTGDFLKIKELNDANSERIKKERFEANKTVLKSYRIKT